MSQSKLSSTKAVLFRLLRFLGALALIYCSMVFYLALTERQIAFPRAITHKEANSAIQGKAKAISCTLEDGLVLGGWQYGADSDPILLYFPDSDEDGAQFLAESGTIDQLTIVTFNYRGSANNKGTPSADNFQNDATQITACASQINGSTPRFFAGRGVGAILAAEQFASKSRVSQSGLILVDPAISIADKINEKYRLLYPKFLVRTNISMTDLNKFPSKNNVLLIQDRQNQKERNDLFVKQFPEISIVSAPGKPLQEKLAQAVQHFAHKTR